MRAAKALARAGETKEAITAPAAMVAKDDGTGFAQSGAASALASFGPKAKDALPVLEAALKSQHTSVRTAAASAVWQSVAAARRLSPCLWRRSRRQADLFADLIAGVEPGRDGQGGHTPAGQVAQVAAKTRAVTTSHTRSPCSARTRHQPWAL